MTREQEEKNNLALHVRRKDTRGILRALNTPAFRSILSRAYRNKSGRSVGQVGKAKVLVVSGSRNMIDWINNLRDSFYTMVPGLQLALSYEAIMAARHMRRAGADVAVGHSRGGAIVARMDAPENRKIAINGATRLAGRRGTGIINLYQDNLFDRILAHPHGRADRVMVVKRRPGDRFHNVAYSQLQPYRQPQPHTQLQPFTVERQTNGSFTIV